MIFSTLQHTQINLSGAINIYEFLTIDKKIPKLFRLPPGDRPRTNSGTRTTVWKAMN